MIPGLVAILQKADQKIGKNPLDSLALVSVQQLL